MRHTPITAKRPTTELLADLVRIYGELSSRGSLADAPTDLVNALDAGDDAARELIEWLGEQVPQRPMAYAEWNA